MPGKHKNRFSQRYGNPKTTGMLVTSGDITSGNQNIFNHDRENIVSRMDRGARLEAQGVMRERFDTASPQTNEMARKMELYDDQYEGLFSDDKGDEEERFFLPKTREDIDIVYAFLLDTVTQLRPLVHMLPKNLQMATAALDVKKAKVAELMVQFYFDDVWKIVDNQFPRWLKHFLKYSQAIYKISYMETNYNPDLLLDVVDRSLLYFDPAAKRVEDCNWIMERYFIPKHEVIERVDRGDWVIPSDEMGQFEAHMSTGDTSNDALARYMGAQNSQMPSLESDEWVEIVDYWQYPRKGLGDVYAVMVGGVEGMLVRYGKNFNPYKFNQYISSSYNQGEHPDGMGMCEQLRPFQKVINSWVNLRNDDVLSNVNKTAIGDGSLITKETQEEIRKGYRIARVDEAVAEAYRAQGMKMTDAFAELPSGTSTENLLTMDLPFVLGQRQESSHISDVFRGGNPPPGTPLGIVQEQLTRNAGAFKPVIRQVMLPFERMAEVMLHFFKSDEFYSEERVISIIGKNRYQDVMPEAWKTIGDDVQAIQVTPDMMNVDLSFNAVSGADAFAARTMLNTTIANLLQGLGQVPDLVPVIKEDFNFSALWEHLLNVSGLDIDRLKYTPEQKKQRQQQEQAAMQQQQQMVEQQMQQQVDMQNALETTKAQLSVMIDAAKQEMKQKTQIAIDEAKINNMTEKELETIITKIVKQQQADAKQALVESLLEQAQMKLEAKLEKDNQVTNVNPAGGGNIQTSKTG